MPVPTAVRRWQAATTFDTVPDSIMGKLKLRCVTRKFLAQG
jgi:hypothetical protein